jgi:hypothetical protein
VRFIVRGGERGREIWGGRWVDVQKDAARSLCFTFDTKANRYPPRGFRLVGSVR